MAIDEFITASLPQHSRSITDRYIEAEEDEIAKYTITTAKDLHSIKLAAKSNVDAIFEKQEHIGLVIIISIEFASYLTKYQYRNVRLKIH